MLTDREKEIIRLRDEEGLAWSKIAAELGTSKGSAYSSYRNAQYKLQRGAPDSETEASKRVETTEEEASSYIIRLPG
jgi:DNA-directed RNA polymerase specialized sigma24 family protein